MALAPIHLLLETGGAWSGSVYAVSGDLGHLVWSPRWRSEVGENERITHVGILGASTCIGWSEAAGVAPAMLAPRDLGEVEPQQHAIEAVILAAGVCARPLSTPPPPATAL